MGVTGDTDGSMDSRSFSGNSGNSQGNHAAGHTPLASSETHDAGTTEPEVLGVDQIRHLIHEAGYDPVQRSTVYEEIGAQV